MIHTTTTEMHPPTNGGGAVRRYLCVTVRAILPWRDVTGGINAHVNPLTTSRET